MPDTKPVRPKSRTRSFSIPPAGPTATNRATSRKTRSKTRRFVEPDGTGPTSTGTFDAPEDQQRGSGDDKDKKKA